MAKIDMAKLDELEALLANGSQGEWFAEDDEEYGGIFVFAQVKEDDGPLGYWREVSQVGPRRRHDILRGYNHDEEMAKYHQAIADAKLIATLHEEMPRLIMALREAYAAIDFLQANPGKPSRNLGEE